MSSLNTKIGPTNADIANATALVVPDAADITAAVPTASAIASAVAAPSAATIASSVAGAVPTLAQINTAVNTQTNNSAIASAVAGAVPTIGAITSVVQANAGSPFGGTYASFAVAGTVGAQSITISGLSSYKYIKCVAVVQNNANGRIDQFIRANGITSGYSWLCSRQNTTTSPFSSQGYGTLESYIRPMNSDVSNTSGGVLTRFEMRDNNATTPVKDLVGTCGWQQMSSSAMQIADWNGQVWTSSAIDSITFIQFNGSYGANTVFYIYGAY